jgi:hypothetical protein
MTSAEIEKALHSLEQQHEADRQSLDSKIAGVRPGLETEAAKWINREVESLVVDAPDVVTSLGIERLREFKNRVKALNASLPAVVANETSKREEWPHHAAPLGQVSSNLVESYFPAVFRRIVSHLGPILDEFKLMTEPFSQSSSWSKEGNLFRYRIHIGFSSEAIPAIREYDQHYKPFQTVESEISKLKKSLAEARAKELWESA